VVDTLNTQICNKKNKHLPSIETEEFSSEQPLKGHR